MKNNMDPKHNLKKTLSVVLIAALISCQSATKNDESHGKDAGNAEVPPALTTKDPVLAKDMQVLSENLSQLLPLAFSPQEFNDKKNEAVIAEKLLSLEETAKSIKHSPMQTMTDPSLNFISYDFREQVRHVRESFSEGKKDYARYELIKTSNFCIECHTRTSSGPTFTDDNFNNRILKLNPLNRAEYFTATRNFDKALGIYLDYFKEPLSGKNTVLQTEKAALQALVITVRFQNSWKKSLQLAQAIQKSPHAPYYLKLSATSWQKDIEQWKKDEAAPSKKKSSKKLDLKKAKHWLEISQTRRFEQGALGGEVFALRTISRLNAELPTIKSPEARAETFYLLGQSYLASVYSEHTNVGEKYLESCIRSYPKTPWAKRCYQKYEEVIYSSYTGSAGTFLPLTEETKLHELFSLIE